MSEAGTAATAPKLNADLRREISAAAKSGFPFYVYMLSYRDGVFYVGKGKGGRVFDHARRHRADTNKAKKDRISACNGAPRYSISAYFSDAQTALAHESDMIRGGSDRLTNINMRPVKDPRQAAIEAAQLMLSRMAPFEQWNVSRIPLPFMGATTYRQVYERMKETIEAEVVEPTPTALVIDAAGRIVRREWGAQA